MEYQFPLTATSRDGETRIFNDAESFRAFAYDWRTNGNVGAYWYEGTETKRNGNRVPRRMLSEPGDDLWRRIYSARENDWIVRDNAGRVVDKAHFGPPVYPRGKWASWWDRRQEEKTRAAENGLPIPGTGNCRRYKHSPQGAYSKNGKNGAHNQRKGIKLFEDPKIQRGDFDDL